jgi:drug/metabolite transporter (DMT)-like permease
MKSNKLGGRGKAMQGMVLLVIYIMLCQSGLLFMKLGADDTSVSAAERILSLNLNYYTILGMVLYVGSFLLYVNIIGRYNLSYIAPIITGVGYIITIVLAVTVLREKLSIFQWIGVGVILVGIAFMNFKPLKGV